MSKTQEVKDFGAFVKVAVGLKPLPEDGRALAQFVAWAQREHILGQVAAVVIAKPGSKLNDILENARLRSAYDKRMLSFETNRIKRALMGLDIQPILLKGSAYVAEHLLAGVGRRVSDIDILVAQDQLPKVERALMAAGWGAEESTSGRYDQSYYRKWMHELPPLRHQVRRTLVDVHHRLLPRTARIQPDHEKMMRDAVLVQGADLRVFSPTDRFIHSAIHIFADGAFDTPARSFIELYYLYADLSEEEQGKLPARAKEVKASVPVGGALWALESFFDIRRSGAGQLGDGVGSLVRKAITAIAEEGRLAWLGRVFLYVRSHYLRMPLPLLARHLWNKMLRRV